MASTIHVHLIPKFFRSRPGRTGLLFETFLRTLGRSNIMPNPDLPACQCQWFERTAKDPTIPIEFDEVTREYHLIHSAGGYSMLYHCPFCGGKAPQSLRQSYWTKVTHEESLRLHDLTRQIKTPEELFAAFDRPDEDYEISGGCTTQDTDETPPETTVGPRRVVFQGLSEIADVHVRIDRYDRLRFSFVGRYIGPRRN